MDARTLSEMTRSQLEAEARKHGVEAPEVLTRDELIDVILARTGQRRSPLSAARDLVSRLVGLGRRSPTSPPPRPSSPPQSPPPSDPRAPASAAAPAPPVDTAAASSGAQRGAAETSAPTSGGAKPGGVIPGGATSGLADESLAHPPQPSSERAGVEAASSAHALAAAPAPETMPIMTRTMARLYAEQGHVERALRVYERLLERDRDDVELRREAEALRSRSGSSSGAVAGAATDPGSAVADVAPTSASPGASPVLSPVPVVPVAGGAGGPTLDLVRSPAVTYGRDEVVALAVDATTVYVHWEATAPALDRAAAAAGAGARPCVRVVVVSEGPSGAPLTHVVVEPVPAAGETFVRALPPSASVIVAVGALAGDRFVAVAHAAPVVTPPASPTDAVAVRFARPPGPRRQAGAGPARPAPATFAATPLPFDAAAAREALRVSAAVDAGALDPDLALGADADTSRDGHAPAAGSAEGADGELEGARAMGSSERVWRRRGFPRRGPGSAPAGSAPAGSEPAGSAPGC